MYSWNVRGSGRWLFGKSVALHLAKERVAEAFKNWRPFTYAYIYDQETARTICRSREGDWIDITDIIEEKRLEAEL